MKVGLANTLADDLAAQLGAQERGEIEALVTRGGVQVLTCTDGATLQGYAVFGLDDGAMLVVYMARAVSGLVTRAAMAGLFGAAQIMGVPVRVHTAKVEAMARMMGAPVSFATTDGDGLPMGVFHG